MLAVLITIWSSLRQTRSTHDTLPERMAETVRSTVSQPMSLAKWLNVPAGKTASGNPADTATDAAEATVPSPPPTPSTSARSAAARNTVSGSSSLTEFDDLGLGELLADFVDNACAVPAARGRVDDEDDAVAVGTFGGLDPQRLGRRQLRRHDGRNQPSAQYRDRGPDAEAGEHVAGIVRPGGHPRQAHQAGQQRQRPAPAAGSPGRRQRRMRPRWPNVRREASSTSAFCVLAAPAAPCWC